MTRTFKPWNLEKPELRAVYATPTDTTPTELEWPNGDAQPTRVEARNACPYKPGSVVYFDGRTGIVAAVVTHVLTHRRERMGDAIAQLRVAPLTRKGEWSRTWFYVFPGDIERAFEKMRQERAAMQSAGARAFGKPSATL